MYCTFCFFLCLFSHRVVRHCEALPVQQCVHVKASAVPSVSSDQNIKQERLVTSHSLHIHIHVDACGIYMLVQQVLHLQLLLPCLLPVVTSCLYQWMLLIQVGCWVRLFSLKYYKFQASVTAGRYPTLVKRMNVGSL